MSPAERFIASQARQRELAASKRSKKLRENRRIPLYAKQSVVRDLMKEAVKRNMLVGDLIEFAAEALKAGKV